MAPCGYGRLWGQGSAVWQQPGTRCVQWGVRGCAALGFNGSEAPGLCLAVDLTAGNETIVSCDGQCEQGGQEAVLTGEWRTGRPGGCIDSRLAAASLVEPGVGRHQHRRPAIVPGPYTSCPPPTSCGLAPATPYAPPRPPSSYPSPCNLLPPCPCIWPYCLRCDVPCASLAARAVACE